MIADLKLGGYLPFDCPICHRRRLAAQILERDAKLKAGHPDAN